jgi:hypothetical protein
MRRALAATLAAALALGGCGSGPSDEEQVRGAVTDFGRATAAKDYQALCDRILAPQLVAEVKQVGLPCEVALQQGLGDVKDPKLTIGKIAVNGDKATAEVRTVATGQAPSSDVLQLVRVGDAWRIASLGD